MAKAVAEWRAVAKSFKLKAGEIARMESAFDHEDLADDRHPLPVTETGYRSHFCHRSDVEAHGGPVGFAIAWLDNEAVRPEWKARLAAFRQPSLF